MSEDASANPFWDYSLSVYRREGVAPLCLALQNDHGLDVNCLLYGGWLASMGQLLTLEHVRQLDQAVAHWRDSVVRPLRELRIALRDFEPAAQVRDRVKALELDAERQQQDAMYRFFREATPLPRQNGAMVENLTLMSRLAGREGASPDRQLRNLAPLLAV